MIYFIILALLFLLTIYYDFGNNNLGKIPFFYLVLIMLICLSGFRYRVGGDTLMYMQTYGLLPTLNELDDFQNPFAKLQPLWLLLVAFSKSISKEFFILQFMHAIILNSIIFGFIRKHTRYIFTAVLFYYFGYYFYFNFEILRESLAIAIFILSLDYLFQKKWFKYYLLSIVGLLFHFSAIILFFIPLIVKFRLRTLSYILIFVLGYLLNPFFISSLKSLAGSNALLISIFTYLDYNYTIYGLLSLLVLNLIYPLFIRYVNESYLKIKSQLNPLLNVYIFIGAITPMFYIFYRFANYLLPVFFLILANCFVVVVMKKTKHNSKIIMLILILCSVSFIHTKKYFSDTSEYVNNSRWYSRWYPYHSIFDKEEDPVREKLIIEQSKPRLNEN
ncbi:MAG: EpsG family protein [Gracilimonas sp.]|uniref:EpsG family protein n=1 Tax=Gracilimonas sp. TaxID=1974203 RepID=UPI00198C6125|nr:EpsG family protein [Gracilimonas sp.]MBD3614984.1 EpsG family protein [Gracilimonas sp.]